MKRLLVLCIFSLFGCQWIGNYSNNKPNIIIIAIEGLNYDSALCYEDRGKSGGITELCSQSIKFTHLYTPTPLSQGGFASLFTGQTTENHRVFHNGRVHLDLSWDTIAEKAVRNGASAHTADRRLNK